MQYDFTTIRDGRAEGSYKWLQLDSLAPGLPKEIVPLSVADMEFPLAPEIAEGMYEYLKTAIIGYTLPTQSYYDAVIRWMKTRHDWDIEKEHIIPFQGVVPIIAQAIQKLTNEGDGILILTPVYHPFRMTIEATNRTVVTSSLAEEEGVYTIDYDDLAKKAKEAKLLLFCSPHNPVGRVWKREELEKVAQIAREHDLILFSDEIHHDLIHQGHTHTVFAKVAGDTKMLTATAPTKTFNLAGAKVSNLIVKDPELKEKFGSGGDNMPSAPGLKLCELAYDRGADWLDALLAQVKENELAFRNILKQKAPIIRFSELEGTYLLWADLRAMAQPKEDLERFVQENGIFPIFGDRFGEEGFGFIRINLAAPKEVIEAAANRLGDAIQQKACCW